MAPRKRTRDVNDVDGEVEIESASSSFRQALPKRSKVALARENGGSVVSDDEAGDGVDGVSGEDTPIVNTSPEYSESEDDEIDELRATQIIEKQMCEFRDNMASEQGVIEEVYCRNFMCHAKLRIKLGPLINFIIGHNGSGKSAVLTALTMCLGGKAATTNRGAALKNMIKEGQDSATLAVKIKNQGDGAYKPDLYGSSITVERHFTRTGTSGFKLKNAQDKLISTKKADLDDILDFFAFQLDNPINVLNQDMARQFLSNSTASDKYKFFIRGTQLEVLDADYKLLEEHLDSIVAKLYTREQDIEILKRKKDEAEERKKRLERTQTIRQKINDLGRMHAWAQVEEQEAELEKCERRVANAEEAVQERKDAAEHVDGVYEGHNQAWEATKRSLADFQTQLDPVKENHRVEKDSFDANKKELLDLKAEERMIGENFKKNKADVRKVEASIKAEQERLSAAEGPEHTERLEKLEELKESAEQAKREQMTHGTGVAELERKKNEAMQRHESAKPQYTKRKDGLQRAQQRLRTAQDEQPRPYAGFRPNMEALVRAVNRETRWRSKPIGPIGMHVKLLKQDWASHIERTFGGVLDSFVVACKEDADILTQIMKKVNCTPGLLIGNPEPLDTTCKEPEGGVDTILRVLEIDNHTVRNQLIINQAIEQTVLIPKRAEAYAYAYEGPRPRNVRAVVCQDDNDRRKGWRFEWSKSGASKTSPVYRWESDFRMKADREDQIAVHREDLEQAKRALHATEGELKELSTAEQKAKQEVVRFHRRQKELLIASQEAEDAVTALQNEIEASRPQDGKLQELENQLASAKEDVEAAERSYMDMVNEKDRLGGIAKEIKARLDAVQAELDQATKRVSNAGKRVQDIEVARTEALREKNKAHAQIGDAEGERTRLERARDIQREQVADFTSKAEEKLGARVPVERGVTPAALDKRIDKLIAERERAEREAGGTPEELLAAYHEAKQEHDEAAAVMKDMNEVATVLHPGISSSV